MKEILKKISMIIGVSAISIIFGEFIGIALVGVGILLSLTIIGAIIGIPMIFCGLAFMIFAPFGGATILLQVKKPCPNCQSQIAFSKNQAAITCPICLKRIKIENKGETLTVV